MAVENNKASSVVGHNISVQLLFYKTEQAKKQLFQSPVITDNAASSIVFSGYILRVKNKGVGIILSKRITKELGPLKNDPILKEKYRKIKIICPYKMKLAPLFIELEC
jgi:hypothetical protein